VLTNVHLTVRRGELIGVAGRVGSGKSSLLLALLGELMPVGWTVETGHRVRRALGVLAYESTNATFSSSSGQDGPSSSRRTSSRFTTPSATPTPTPIYSTKEKGKRAVLPSTSSRAWSVEEKYAVVAAEEASSERGGGDEEVENGSSSASSASSASSSSRSTSPLPKAVPVSVPVPVSVSELELESVGPFLRGHVAYCSQVPWIFEGTVRENVLFGAAYDERRYLQVIEACALRDDLRRLPAGEATLIGERGVNLSGGQKARVCLARACYAQVRGEGGIRGDKGG
jgi:energy-coupling factor transporter ATP-binding protein EcfA2